MLRILTFLLLVLWIALWVLPIFIAYLLKKKKLRDRFIRILSKGILIICRVKVSVIGAVPQRGPLLVASNHLSYLDIPILASIINCRFVAKKEIRSWPVINGLCKIQDVAFIDRSVAKISEGSGTMSGLLAKEEIVVFFPEATTGNGKHLLPFKPAFFECAGDVPVMPVAVAYRKIRGLPIDQGQWPKIAWYGDMSLMPHLLELLSLGRIEVEVHFLPTLQNAGRKELALQAYSSVEQALVGGFLTRS